MNAEQCLNNIEELLIRYRGKPLPKEDSGTVRKAKRDSFCVACNHEIVKGITAIRIKGGYQVACEHCPDWKAV